MINYEILDAQAPRLNSLEGVRYVISYAHKIQKVVIYQDWVNADGSLNEVYCGDLDGAVAYVDQLVG